MVSYLSFSAFISRAIVFVSCDSYRWLIRGLTITGDFFAGPSFNWFSPMIELNSPNWFLAVWFMIDQTFDADFTWMVWANGFMLTYEDDLIRFVNAHTTF